VKIKGGYHVNNYLNDQPSHSIEIKFGLKLKELRLVRKITQGQLAYLSGLHRNYISDTERGRRNVSLRCIEKIALGLNCEIKDLF